MTISRALAGVLVAGITWLLSPNVSAEEDPQIVAMVKNEPSDPSAKCTYWTRLAADTPRECTGHCSEYVDKAFEESCPTPAPIRNLQYTVEYGRKSIQDLKAGRTGFEGTRAWKEDLERGCSYVEVTCSEALVASGETPRVEVSSGILGSMRRRKGDDGGFIFESKVALRRGPQNHLSEYQKPSITIKTTNGQVTVPLNGMAGGTAHVTILSFSAAPTNKSAQEDHEDGVERSAVAAREPSSPEPVPSKPSTKSAERDLGVTVNEVDGWLRNKAHLKLLKKTVDTGMDMRAYASAASSDLVMLMSPAKGKNLHAVQYSYAMPGLTAEEIKKSVSVAIMIYLVGTTIPQWDTKEMIIWCWTSIFNAGKGESSTIDKGGRTVTVRPGDGVLVVQINSING